MTFFFRHLTIRKRTRKSLRKRKPKQKPLHQLLTATPTCTATAIDDLPSHILIIILSRLPLNAIFISRCVSKTWNLLISDPDFTPSSNNTQLFLRADSPTISKTLHWLNLHDNHAISDEFRTTLRFRLPQRLGVVVNSCHGLLCLSTSFFQNPNIICNPITGQYITIPEPEYDFNLTGNVVSGFGCSLKTKRFKVLRLVLNRFLLCMAEIYTFGLDTCWRKLGYAPLAPVGGLFPTYLNGVLHWACDDFDASHFIVGFDFENECFCVVPAPKHFDVKHKEKKRENLFHWNMCVLGGCLAICDFDEQCNSCFDVWVMNDYGVQQSWTKQFKIEKCCAGVCRPIMLLPDDEDVLLLFCKRNGLVLRDRLGKSRGCLKISHSTALSIQAISFVPSFLSLKDAVGVDVLKVASRFDGCEEDGSDESFLLVG